MAKAKKAIKKIANRRPAGKAAVAPKKKVAAREPRTIVRASPAPKSASVPESKEVLAKGCEWYDDGGNEGLKQRPITKD